jgi:cell pole-organizing protein PopZ
MSRPKAQALVSERTEAAASQSLSTLSALIVRNYEGAENTLEGLVREMLKPMLREWLDANLPEIVESTVAREIARLTRRD